MRITRAALRAQVHEEPPQSQLIHEDADADTDSFHLSAGSNANTESSSRPPLKDITTETNPPSHEDPFTDESGLALKKAKGKKKGRQQTKKETETVETDDTTHGELPLDEGDALAENRAALDSDSILHHAAIDSDSILHHAALNSTSTPHHTALDSDSTPHYITAEAPKTPKFNPAIHKPVEGIAALTGDLIEDSFVEKITSRTPGRMLSSKGESRSPDSFVEQITSRTSRIEDSVEAIDALEDAIERIAETLPALEDLKMESPVKSRKNTPARINLSSDGLALRSTKKAGLTPARTQRESPAKTRTVPKASDRPKPTVSRQSSVRTTGKPAIKPAVKPAVATNPVKKPINDGHKPRPAAAQPAPPSLSFSNSPAKSLPNTTKKRVPSENLSTSRPPFVPTKSSKPPTKPTFQLPGEAISAKLRAEREERLKREEETEKERKVFKARPVPAKVARPSVVPRENKASQARMSIYANGINKENVAPKSTTVSEPKPRPLSLDAKPKAADSTATKANSSVRRTASSAAAQKPRVSSLNLTAGQKSAVTKNDAVHQKAKGKEVFGRSKAEMERAEKERREKEEATRKARAAAAERGRQASREWAEKQKKKIAQQAQAKLLAAKASEGVEQQVVAGHDGTGMDMGASTSTGTVAAAS
ncbi:hypothetical protein A1O7_09395 [Cladophialophora yegresii CBS 114405]|uniref:Carboxylesterase family protein n=1 Tax=Cladophialophora yegresii CBS 114405 TaxID=1182544 RepID=W9VF11_9EURO|nr:uncharacterized protein A1O7_09395 [Cladophialophora yegresii CBS 114405]EXJ54058.1 hypothetical protein A1O7_09395 [Cladophialophora yegresii CBS 114405]